MRILCGTILAAAMVAFAGNPLLDWIDGHTEPREFTGANGSVFRYRVAEKAAPEGGKVPLVLFMHGAGERGDDNKRQLNYSAYEIVKWLDAHEAGFRFIAGQVPDGKQWVDVPWGAKRHDMPEEPSVTMALQLELLDAFLADPLIDTNRIYATGLSMGGYGTWDIICRRPDVFAAAIPICGGCDLAQAPRIAHIPVWAFHGSNDNVVPVCRSRGIMSALWAAGSNAHYREYPDWGHGVWSATYCDKAVLAWLFKQKRH